MAEKYCSRCVRRSGHEPLRGRAHGHTLRRQILDVDIEAWIARLAHTFKSKLAIKIRSAWIVVVVPCCAYRISFPHHATAVRGPKPTCSVIAILPARMFLGHREVAESPARPWAVDRPWAGMAVEPGVPLQPPRAVLRGGVRSHSSGPSVWPPASRTRMRKWRWGWPGSLTMPGVVAAGGQHEGQLAIVQQVQLEHRTPGRDVVGLGPRPRTWEA